MRWAQLYENHDSWSEVTLLKAISKLENIGSGEEVIEVISCYSSSIIKDRLIKKAMELGVHITHNDFFELSFELSDEVYRELADYSGFDANEPDIDENNLTWDDFYCFFDEWTVENTLRRINKLKNIGSADEVIDVLENMSDPRCRELLYKKAVEAGVRLNNEQLETMGIRLQEPSGYFKRFMSGFFGRLISGFGVERSDNELDEDDSDSNEDEYEDDTDKGEDNESEEAAGLLLGIMLGMLSGDSKKKHSCDSCDGDCENCPPHYGYRYGRWYYGHGHQHGCERGGNGGASGRTDRD